MGEPFEASAERDEVAADLATSRARVAELEAEVSRLRGRVAQLEGLEGGPATSAAVAWTPSLFPSAKEAAPLPAVTQRCTSDAKVALYRALFVGRDDVHAYYWEDATSGRRGWAPASKPGWKRRGEARETLPLTDDVVEDHLRGRTTAGLYPLMPGDVCRLLVCDLDGPGWQLDALAYLEAASVHGVPVALERSRSGDGGHLWTFFDAPVPAASARALGAAILREAMAVRAELDLTSYDRLFPAQDFLPEGKSFGNLIALPLQGGSRQRDATVFLDPATLRPWPDQWAFLSSVARLSPDAVESLTTTLRSTAVGPDVLGYRSASRRSRSAIPPPELIGGVRGAMVGIRRIGVPPAVLADLKHAASVHNPDFYRLQHQRKWTGDTPRLIRCYEEDLEHLWLPRGLEEHAARIVADAGSHLELDEVLPEVDPIEIAFRGRLTPTQQTAVDALAAHRLGVLVAPTGAGKTAMACALIAHHRTPTLIVVDRAQLADQWRTQLADLLGLTGRAVGQLGSGRKRRTRVVDLAMFQSIARRSDDPDVFEGYGLVVVDECHHIPAKTFERAVRHAPVHGWLGLTATPHREDGLHPLITMQCGPVRTTIARTADPLVLQVVTHESLADPELGLGAAYQDFVTALAVDAERNAAIVGDVSAALARGRDCLVLTQRTEHLEALTSLLAEKGHTAYVLRGGMGNKERVAVTAAIGAHPDDQPLLVVATGPYAGEGFDCPRLDTLFLVLPIKSKTKLTQYVGRVMRAHPDKTAVEVHDYHDTLLPIFKAARAARVSTYASLGFDVDQPRRRR